ncbi:glycosyltransferase [Agrococcus sp. KRD186]|uniref:glycosyltransferase n=1 Tax=Agrococcus sp. KRD186 TaxID=2729730 RepID=UPI0019D0FBAD|nr:glycosyltransferase [Agrococcus sp. KRD186]
MRMLLATAGSRGDVEPFVALAQRACERGHEVLLLGPAGTAELARAAAGVVVREVDADFRRMIHEQGTSALGAARAFRRVVRPAMRAVLLGAAEAALEFGPDVILHHPKVLSAPLAASRVGAARAVVELVPSVTPTAAFPAPGTVPFSLGPLNRATYGLGGAASAMFRAELREAAALLGDPEPAAAAASLVPVSPTILPRPSDWPATAHLTGAWVTDGGASEALDPAVDAFLDHGDVVTVGFGSMVAEGAARRGAAFVLAARALGLRTLVLRGWGGADVPPHLLGDDVWVADAAPHAAVLPRSVVAVHHGGAGTSHAAVRAGAPSVVVPFTADQPFWARTLHRQSLAAAPLPQRRVTVQRAATAIEQALRCHDSTAEAAAAVAQEDGTGVALDIIESLR